MNDELQSQLQKQYPLHVEVDMRTLHALVILKHIAAYADENNMPYAVVSGLATDAHFGYLTRNHRDVDVIVPHEHATELSDFLTTKGHHVYEPEEVRGDTMKIDQAEEGKPLRAHGDIQFFFEQDGELIVPSCGRELRFRGELEDLTTQLSFQGVTARFLNPQMLIQEKELRRTVLKMKWRTCYQEEVDKLRFLIEIQKQVSDKKKRNQS